MAVAPDTSSKLKHGPPVISSAKSEEVVYLLRIKLYKRKTLTVKHV